MVKEGSGKRRKGIWLKNINLKDAERKALNGFHTGNVPAFFRKRKKPCWFVMKKSEKFMKVYSELGRDQQLTGKISDILEEYVCTLYGSTNDFVCVTRYDMFMKKHMRENKPSICQCYHFVLHLCIFKSNEHILYQTCGRKQEEHKYCCQILMSIVGKQTVA